MGRAAAKKVCIIALLDLLCVLVTVSQSQTVPYLMFLGSKLSNHSYIPLNNGANINSVGFYGSGKGVECHTDLTGCCDRGEYGINDSVWYFPNGSRLLFDQNKYPLHTRIRVKKVTLYQQYLSNASQFGALEINKNVCGIYRCKIPISSSPESEEGIIYAGIYEENKGIMYRSFSVTHYYYIQVV